MKPPQGKKHRRKFTGKRTGTATVDNEVVGGFPYHKRADGSRYPVTRTITVPVSTKRIYDFLREEGGYHNHVELLLDLALPIVENRSLLVSSLTGKSLILSEDMVKILQPMVTQAKLDRGLMKAARKKAFQKRRYQRRKT